MSIVSSFKLEIMLKYISIAVIFLRYFELCEIVLLDRPIIKIQLEQKASPLVVTPTLG